MQLLPCILVASNQVVEVLEVDDMNVSEALGKYRITDQVQEISRGSPNIGA